MSIAAGARLGPYEIVAPLGAGGMGEVYRARDTRLNREVAVKILPEAFAADKDRLARFRREAQVLAALNHPQIAAIYGLEESSGVEALVLELVPGETLAERLAQGPLPLEETLEIARQIAEALEAAHERGIVHRDLKPANVKLTPEGKVKVLDFGLAKALSGDASSPDVSASPTLTAQATQAGVVIGTAAYMSPEQARGRSVDKRADVWAWGCVLYEMLTGRRCFEEETVSDTLAAVLRADPDWSLLPPATPQGIRSVLKRCLQKDLRERLRDIADARLGLTDSPALLGASDSAIGTGPVDSRARMRWAAAAGLAGLVLGGALVGGWLGPRSRRQASGAISPVRLNLDLGRGQTLPLYGIPNFAVSRDGTRIAYVARSESGPNLLYLRSLDSFDAKPLPETEGASAPFFSPDGQWVGYVAAAKIRKVPVSGGPSQPVCDAAVSDSGGGAAWTDEGNIFIPSTSGGLLRASASGGACAEIIKPDPERGELIQPEALPGGRALLFAMLGGFQTSQARIATMDLKTGKLQVIGPQGTNPRYVEPGFIVFGHAGEILAAPFDSGSLKLLGQPVPVVDKVLPDPAYGIEQFAVSPSGVLAFVPGTRAAVKRRLVAMDPKGVATVLTTEANAYEDMSLSPNGRKLALTLEGVSWNIWVFDRDRGTLTRLTFDNDNRDPIWTPDGKRVVYTSLRDGRYGLYARAADGSGTEERLLTSKNWIFANSWSPDGRYMAYGEQDPTSGFDISILPLEGDRKPFSFVRSSFQEWFGEFSPDGKWIAYESNESGRSEIYVRPFPGPGGKWQISSEGGARPEWSRDGRDLHYMRGEKLMRVPVDTARVFSAGRPEALFSCACYESGRYYEVGADGKHFLFIQNTEPVSPVTQLNMMLGWRGELERRSP
jgi:serine/threonine protein kinase/Tol biopolymer transport system component